MRRTRRRTVGLLAAGLTAVLLAGACSSSDRAAETITSKVTVPATPSADGNGMPAPTSSDAGGDSAVSSTPGSSSPAPDSSKPAASATASSTPGSSKPSSSSKPTTSAPPVTASYDDPQDGVALPDGFVPKKLKAGEKPPQFVVVSFDGVGWNEKWQYWFDIAEKVPFRFTGFLSGTYMLSDETKDHYQGPYRDPGSSDINWNTAQDLPTEINDVNQALDSGMEIGSHFNGHFCSGGNLPAGNEWTEADWDTELDQFFALVKNYRANNPDVDLPALKLKASDIRGERTPCLEGHITDLFPALKSHGITYDSSFTRRGISWPTRSEDNNIWQIGMAEYPMHGTLPDVGSFKDGEQTHHVQITMDYNFWISQRTGETGTPEQSKQDSQQVVDTYQDMYDSTFDGNRAPLVLGNHFNQWNNNAYSDAIGTFVLNTCGKPDTECVPFRDLIAWMEVQDPARLADLQAQAPELGAAG